MVKNIIKLVMHALLIIFFSISYNTLAMLGRLGQVARRAPTQVPKPMPSSKAPSLEPVQMPPKKRELPSELKQLEKQPGGSIRISRTPPQLSQEEISVPIKPSTGKPQITTTPGIGGQRPPISYKSRFETIKNIQISPKQTVVNTETLEKLKKLLVEGYPGSNIARDLISQEPIDIIKQTFEQDKNDAQQSGYRIGFIYPKAENTRTALASLFGRSLDDIPSLVWQDIILDNIPFLEFIELPDQSIIFLERTSNTSSLLIGEPVSESLINKLNGIIDKPLPDTDGAIVLQKAKELAIKEVEANKLAEIEKELTKEKITEKEITKLTQELASTEQEIAINIQQHAEELKRILQETETINAQADVELIEFQKKQHAEKEKRLAQAKAEARKTQAFNDLDIEQQEKFFKRLEGNYTKKIEQDLANKKQVIQAEKNKRIQAAKSKIKKLEIEQQELQQNQKILQKKIQQQEALSLEIAEGTETLANMINESQADELLRAQIRQKATDAQKQFDLEKKQIETEFNQKLENAQQERIQKYQKNKKELKNNIDFIQKNSAQQELLLEQLEKNELQETKEIQKALEIQKNKKIVEIEQLYIQKNQELQQQLEAEEKKHATSKELLEEQQKHVEQAHMEVKKLEQQEQQAKENSAKEAKEDAEKAVKGAQEKVLKLREEAAHKKSELELIQQKTDQTKKTVEETGKDVVQTQQKKEDLEKFAQELEQQITLEKKELSAKQEEELILKQKEDDLIQIKETQIKQELAKKEEAHLEAKIAEQKALAQEQTAKKSAEKTEKDLDDAIKEQQKQEQLHKEKEEEEPVFPQPNEELPEQKPPIKKVQPSYGPHIEAPFVLSEEAQPTMPTEQAPKVGIEQPTMSFFQVPSIAIEEPVLLDGQVPKTREQQPSPISIPAVEIKEPMIEQALPELKPSIKIPEPPMLQQPVAKPVQYPRSQTKPIESIPSKGIIGSSGPMDTTPLRGTPFEQTPFPERKIATHKPIIPTGSSPSYQVPSSSYSGMISSSSPEWSPSERPQTYLPEVKTQAVQQITSKKPRLSRKALILLENLKLLPKEKPNRIEPQTAESKGIGAWLRGLSLLQQQHAATRGKPQHEKETPAVAKAMAGKPNRVVAFIQNVTTVIENAVTTIINTFESYISALKNLF